MKLRKPVLIAIAIAALILSGVLWATRDDGSEQSQQLESNLSNENLGTEESGTEGETENSANEQDSDSDVIEEQPTNEVDDRGGFTPY